MAHQTKEANVRGELDLKDVVIGDTFNYILEVTDEDGNAIDYSTGSEMELRVFAEGTNLKIIDANVASGEVNIDTPGEIAFDIPAEKMELEEREFDYDIRFTDSAGSISTEFGGKFITTLARRK